MDDIGSVGEGLRELALFAGAGGGILGGRLLGWRTVCAVELDEYARDVLVARQNDGSLAPFPIWDDVTTFDGAPWRGCVDVVSGGFPCQDISIAGKGAGIDGERSGLWREFARIIGEVRPRFAFVENSPMLASRGLGRVLGDLAALGYDAQWGCVSASSVGACHERERIWIVAYDASMRWKTWDLLGESGKRRPSLPDRGLFGASVHSLRRPEDFWRRNPPVFCRTGDGVARRLDRLRAIGNGQVSCVAALAWRILSGQFDE